MQPQHAGQFAQLEPQELSSIIDGLKASGEAYWCTLDALDVLAARTLLEIDLIAQRIESVIDITAEGDVESARVGRRPAPFMIQSARRALGDVTLWLKAGAEDAPEPPDAGPVPLGVTRAEYLAVLALCKALELAAAAGAIWSLLEEQRRPEADTSWPSPRYRLHAALLDPLRGTFEIARLAAELSRAAAMAVEAEYLDERVASIRGEASHAFEEMRKRQLREHGAKGGRNRAEAYRPSKDKILQLYRDGGYTGSRAAAADSIFEKLRELGEEIPHSRVLRTLQAEDSRAKAGRATGA
jgi:hypothetical protein